MPDTHHPSPPNGPRLPEHQLVSFPLTGEVLKDQTRALLQDTIWAPEEDKLARDSQFPEVWEAHQEGHGIKKLFEVPPETSPFAVFSSQGWKIHIAFQKGSEEAVSQLLFRNGLYFKTEAGMGTYFNGNRESGSTIYVGGMDATRTVAGYLEGRLKPLLTSGAVQQYKGQTVSSGSGTDIEILPKVTTRFDMGKSPYVSKYTYDSGPPSWVRIVGMPAGLPFLQEDAQAIAQLEKQSQAEPHLLPQLVTAYGHAFERAKLELVHDFGQDYVLGSSSASRQFVEGR